VGLGQFEHPPGGRVVGRLPEEPRLVLALGRQPEVGLYRDPEVGQPVGQVDGVLPTLQLHAVGAGLLHHPAAVLDGVGLVDAEREERHVRDHERLLGGAADGGGAAGDLVDRHGERRVVAQAEVPHGVPHEDHVDAGRVDEVGGGCVVGRQHRDRFLAGLRADVLRSHVPALRRGRP